MFASYSTLNMDKLNLIECKKEFTHRHQADGPFRPFYFVQAADSQFGLIERYVKKLPNPKWYEETELCEAFVAACNKLTPKPKFLVVCGDLVDAVPATENREPQVAEFKRIFSRLDKDIPLVCVCGNHDVGDVPTMDAIKEYKERFGEDYFYFVVNDVLCIVINSQFYENREHVHEYAREQDKWLESMLGECKHFKHSVLFEHIPWFLRDPNEEDEYFNIKRDLRLVWLRKFQQAGIEKIFCGHYHQNAGGWFEDMEVVVTSAIGAQLGGDAKSGARLVKVTEDSVRHEYYATEDMPTSVDL